MLHSPMPHSPRPLRRRAPRLLLPLLLFAAPLPLRAVRPLPVLIRWQVDRESGQAFWTYYLNGFAAHRLPPPGQDWILVVRQVRVTLRVHSESSGWSVAATEPDGGAWHMFSHTFRVDPIPAQGLPLSFTDVQDYGDGIPLATGTSLGPPCVESLTDRIERVEISAEYRSTLQADRDAGPQGAP